MTDQKTSGSKRIVTAQRPDGPSYLATVDAISEDGVVLVWAVDSLPVTLPFDGRVGLRSKPAIVDTSEALARCPSPHPAPTGMRAYLVNMPPEKDGLTYFADLHWHDTCDCIWVIQGEVTIGLDNGDQALARQGDFIVQGGSNHSWRAGKEGATLGIMMLGAKRVGGVEAELARYEDHSFGMSDDVEPVLLDRLERGEPSVRSSHHTKSGYY